MKKLYFILMIVLVASCKKDSKTTDINPVSNQTNTSVKESDAAIAYWTVENLAQEVLNDTYQQTYRAIDVNETRISFDEGTITRQVMILGEGTSDEIFISFEDKKPYEIYWYKSGSWRTENGVRIGTTLETLVNLNGKPVNFYGFGWDYAGQIDPDGGALQDNGFTYFILPAGENINNGAADGFLGDRTFSSTNSKVAGLHATVDRMRYKF